MTRALHEMRCWKGNRGEERTGYVDMFEWNKSNIRTIHWSKAWDPHNMKYCGLGPNRSWLGLSNVNFIQKGHFDLLVLDPQQHLIGQTPQYRLEWFLVIREELDGGIVHASSLAWERPSLKTPFSHQVPEVLTSFRGSAEGMKGMKGYSSLMPSLFMAALGPKVSPGPQAQRPLGL